VSVVPPHESQLNKEKQNNTLITWREMEELHCSPTFLGKSFCFHFIWDVALSLFTRTVRSLFQLLQYNFQLTVALC